MKQVRTLIRNSFLLLLICLAGHSARAGVISALPGTNVANLPDLLIIDSWPITPGSTHNITLAYLLNGVTITNGYFVTSNSATPALTLLYSGLAPQYSAGILLSNSTTSRSLALGLDATMTFNNLFGTAGVSNLNNTLPVFYGDGRGLYNLTVYPSNVVSGGLKVFPWIANNAFNGISNAAPDFIGEFGMAFQNGQIPYLVFGHSTAQGDWRGDFNMYGVVNVGDSTHMLTNGFENCFTANGCYIFEDPTNQTTAADNVICLQNENSKHYSAMRWRAGDPPGGDGGEKGAIGYGNTNANGYLGMNYLEDYADGQSFVFVGGGNLRGGKLGGAGDFAWFTNTLAAWSTNLVRSKASFLIDGYTGGVTNKGGLQVGTTLTASGGAIVLGSTSSANGGTTLLGNNIVLGDGGNLNNGNGSFGRFWVNTKGDICSPSLSFPNFGMSQDNNGNWMLGWCSGTIGTNIFVDVANHEVWITNGTTHFKLISVISDAGVGGVSYLTNGFTAGTYANLSVCTNIVTTNVSLDFPSTGAASFSDLSVSFINLQSNKDFLTINVPAIAQTNGSFDAWISNTTAYVRFHNYAATAINPAAGNFNVRLEQYK